MIDKICGSRAALTLPEPTESSHPASIGEIAAPPMKTMPLRGFALLPLFLASSAFGLSQIPLIMRNLTSTDKPVDPMAPAKPDTAP